MRKWERRLGQAVGIGLGAAALGAAGLVAGGVALARLVVTPEDAAAEPVTVTRVTREDDRLIVWLRGPHADLPGQYSLLLDRGRTHARVGPVLRSGADGAAREILRVDRGSVEAGTRGRLTGWWYADATDLGLRAERIVYPTELGDAEAWIVRPRWPRRARWAVHVHGRGALPAETLRGVLPLARAGITSLVISYRNDPGAPAGELGRYGVGLAESRDVDAAIAEVMRRGAQRITLVGWSMGGTAVLRSATTGRYAAIIDGIVLDSPAVDWPALLRHQAAAVRAPQPFATVGIELLQRGIVRAGEPGGLDFGSVDPAVLAGALTVPTLIHASRGDTFVPSAGAEALAAARPELVQLRLQEQGEHVKLWNVDPAAWEASTEQFVRALPRPPWRGDLPSPPVRLD